MPARASADDIPKGPCQFGRKELIFSFLAGHSQHDSSGEPRRRARVAGGAGDGVRPGAPRQS